MNLLALHDSTSFLLLFFVDADFILFTQNILDSCNLLLATIVAPSHIMNASPPRIPIQLSRSSSWLLSLPPDFSLVSKVDFDAILAGFPLLLAERERGS
ncbi:hypothetical protein C4D60_Mb10t28170 [Musa balbisiana]|uniref:Uncharacterized protein n=1 Tax=Musa balbisiana TaxID=52838 RepID=A0A4V4H556_MUSBA|nr:hypothetical protein C4D60_Mb10t28170 [Musa balbisiana]